MLLKKKELEPLWSVTMILFADLLFIIGILPLKLVCEHTHFHDLHFFCKFLQNGATLRRHKECHLTRIFFIKKKDYKQVFLLNSDPPKRKCLQLSKCLHEKHSLCLPSVFFLFALFLSRKCHAIHAFFESRKLKRNKVIDWKVICDWYQ